MMDHGDRYLDLVHAGFGFMRVLKVISGKRVSRHDYCPDCPYLDGAEICISTFQ